MKRKIVVVYGGKSPEHEVSCDSAASIAKELVAGGHEVRPLYITRGGKWLLQNLSEMGKAVGIEVFPSFEEHCFVGKDGGESFKPDVLFPIIHGTTGEDGIIQGVFELMGIPYTGPGLTASACGMNKAIAKKLAESAGIDVLPHVLITNADRSDGMIDKKLEKAVGLGFPLFVKPVSQGSSVGISRVLSKDSLLSAVENAFRFDTAVMIEKGVDHAREIVCGVIGGSGYAESAPAGEVCVQGSHDFYDYEAKYLDDNGMKLVIPASVPKEKMDYIREASLKVFRALGCTGFARIDFFMDRKAGHIWFGEINTAPGFTSHSLFPALWKSAGVPVINQLEKIIDIAIEEYSSRKDLEIVR